MSKFIKVTSKTDNHVMYVNKNYIMMIEKLPSGSRLWVLGGDHGNVRIVNEESKDILDELEDSEIL